MLPIVAVLFTALIGSGVALGVGPWPGVVRSVQSPQGDVRYSVGRSGESTTLSAVRAGAVIASATFDGSWGIPAVTSTGTAGGLAPDGETLVLGEPPHYTGLRSASRFLVVSTRSLALEKTIALGGEFGFDALSPGAHTLYVIQHTSRGDLISYRVRAYDLDHDRLLPGTIVAKGETETMRGYPIARATSAGGVWVYTLYDRRSGKPFIHALNTVQRSAVCIDLTWQPQGTIWQARLKLSGGGRLLLVQLGARTTATVDTKTLRLR